MDGPLLIKNAYPMHETALIHNIYLTKLSRKPNECHTSVSSCLNRDSTIDNLLISVISQFEETSHKTRT